MENPIDDYKILFEHENREKINLNILLCHLIEMMKIQTGSVAYNFRLLSQRWEKETLPSSIDWRQLFSEDTLSEYDRLCRNEIPYHFRDDEYNPIFEDPVREVINKQKRIIGLYRFGLDDRIYSEKVAELEEVIRCQSEVIADLKRKLGMDNVDYTDVSTKQNQKSDSQVQPVINCIYRDRSRTQTSHVSKIDLREDVPGESTVGNCPHKLQDLVKIIMVLYELGFFVEFDPTLKPNKQSIKNQQEATKKDVFDAIGNALNMPDLGYKYNSIWQSIRNQPIKNKSDKELINDAINIFDIMRDKAKKLITPLIRVR